MPGPDALLDESVEVVDKAVLKLANVMIKILAYQDESIPDKYLGDCSEKEGAGFGGDMSAEASSTPSPDGLLANNC